MLVSIKDQTSDFHDSAIRISYHSMVEPLAEHPGFYAFDCDTTWPLSLHLEGTFIRIPSERLNLGRLSRGSNRCVSGIIGSETLGESILGMPALGRCVSFLALMSRRSLKSALWMICSIRTYFDVGRGQIGLGLD